MRLELLLAALEQPPLAHINGNEIRFTDLDITMLGYDSRTILPGGLFIAVPGTHTDGRLFLANAAGHGAVAAIGEALSPEQAANIVIPYIEVPDVRIALADLTCAFYDYPARRLCTIGVTGTDGKTTTSNLLNAILEASGLRSGLMTTANFRMTGREWENNTRQSTLESLEVQQFLREIIDYNGTHAVIESTSHGLELQRVRGCDFDIGVVTNITHEHLDFHKTLENYRRAKARLFDMLDPSRDKELGIQPRAILNRDDASYEYLKPHCRVPILDYGFTEAAAVHAVDVQFHADSTRFHAVLPTGEILIETRLVGRFNVSNCLAAIAAAYSLGISPDDITRALAQMKGVSGRMENIQEGQPFTVIVDYAHTPDSLEKVLAILRPLTRGKLMVVFGSAGERDVQKRPLMGHIAAQMADFFVITDEDPREEDRERILSEIAAGATAIGKREGHDFLCITDRRQAITEAFALALAGDTILLAGKGHEQSIIIGREKLPWDDRQVAREELQKIGSSWREE